MKKASVIFGVLLIGSLLITSCKTVQVAKFASVEKVVELKINSSLTEVISTLGSKPYNIYSNQKDGYTIYTYKYKLVERNVNPELANSKGGETVGTEVYNKNEQTVFLLFKDNKLESFVTTNGRKDSNPIIMLNNTLYTISLDKGQYIIVPTSIQTESGSSSHSKEGKKKGFLFF